MIKGTTQKREKVNKREIGKKERKKKKRETGHKQDNPSL